MATELSRLAEYGGVGPARQPLDGSAKRTRLDAAAPAARADRGDVDDDDGLPGPAEEGFFDDHQSVEGAAPAFPCRETTAPFASRPAVAFLHAAAG